MLPLMLVLMFVVSVLLGERCLTYIQAACLLHSCITGNLVVALSLRRNLMIISIANLWPSTGGNSPGELLRFETPCCMLKSLFLCFLLDFWLSRPPC
jgi:hypothetical protein